MVDICLSLFPVACLGLCVTRPFFLGLCIAITRSRFGGRGGLGGEGGGGGFCAGASDGHGWEGRIEGRGFRRETRTGERFLYRSGGSEGCIRVLEQVLHEWARKRKGKRKTAGSNDGSTKPHEGVTSPYGSQGSP